MKIGTRPSRWMMAGTVALASVACGQPAPTAPSPLPEFDPSTVEAPLRLSPERHLLQVSAIDLTEAFEPWCQPIAVPRAGKFLTTFLWFERRGEEYVGRSRPPYRSTLELRLYRTGWSRGVATLRGTVTGRAQDEYDSMLGQRDLVFEVTPGQAATFSGVATHQGSTPSLPIPEVSGTLEGSVTFGDSTGALSRCPTASFYLQVVPPGSPHDDPTVPPLVPGLLTR